MIRFHIASRLTPLIWQVAAAIVRRLRGKTEPQLRQLYDMLPSAELTELVADVIAHHCGMQVDDQMMSSLVDYFERVLVKSHDKDADICVKVTPACDDEAAVWVTVSSPGSLVSAMRRSIHKKGFRYCDH